MQTEKLPPQYYFVSHRDVNVGSILGLSIQFEKGVPTHVPRAMHATVMEKGCQPCDKGGRLLDGPEAVAGVIEEKPVRIEPEDPAERAEAIEKAIRQVVKSNRPADFSGGGVPLPSTLQAILGWRVDSKEVRPVWDKVKPTLRG